MTAPAPLHLAPVVGALHPIGLDELVERASLLTRLDRKYMLPIRELPLVLGGLGADVRVLEMAGERHFGYRSVYFDTPELDGYLRTARRRRRRFKLRIRTYLDSGDHYFEVKTSGPRGTTVKQRIPYDGDLWSLNPSARAYADDVLAGAGIDSGGFRFVPTLVTSYRRTTLLLPASDSRVTVDTGLTWTLPDGTGLRTPDRAVVETKSGRAGSEADRLLWSLKHRPIAISKYGTGLAALRPGLPAHRWLPVLRRHFPNVSTALHGSPA
ncbi:polyphosphate polymerase domain-containing protein [Streptomyces sp. ADMS]|uniref:polyphosphate polymerase domain-containing protein n=1 Tax=Streptomyces sp. ADMS TaxID=3071415 RepID=UPI00296EE859|nr:polyphosphate polymerase domain-containing protein [Streptomyces sp. ADMS]MDW4907260.1 polyphosphate polymerase domain-containing protein [Streptomyces sp. ADMS]